MCDLSSVRAQLPFTDPEISIYVDFPVFHGHPLCKDPESLLLLFSNSGSDPLSLSFFFFLIFFFSTFIYFWDRERQSMNGGGAEREGDTESETGSRL